MRRKNVTSEMMKEYITESLLLLLRQKPFSAITIGELTKKAGVNRSTYYRNFSSREDIVKYFFLRIMEDYLDSLPQEDISMEAYLTGMFYAFLDKKEQILVLHRNQVSYLLFDTLNSYFTGHLLPRQEQPDFGKQFELYYHTGGIFNTLLLWFSNHMEPSPEELSRISVTLNLPACRPVLHPKGGSHVCESITL